MKKILGSFLFLSFFAINVSAQSPAPIRRESLGFSLIMNDFATAQRIRSTSLSNVLRDKTFAKSEDFAYGFAINYMKGLRPNVDLAVTLGASFSAEASFPGRTNAGANNLLELDVSGHFKMFSDRAVVNPYLIAGVGASKYTNVYGAIMPLGGGIKIRLGDETELHTQLQYRVPITPEANNYHFQFGFGVSGLL
jgi:hypothetical protein